MTEHRSEPRNPIPMPRYRPRWRARVSMRVFDWRVRLANWVRPW